MNSIPFRSDPRTVLTLDAGGTNLKFFAIRGNQLLFAPIYVPSDAHDLARCLQNIVAGFQQTAALLDEAPVAISFAFPGPADYPAGIIGNRLPNFPAFREASGVPLGPMLEAEFRLPVFINNDGNLFVYGEAIAGFLPYANGLLEAAGNPKRYRNLFGVTLGTGLGGGIVIDGQMLIGDNSIAGEAHLLRNILEPGLGAEEGACIRAVRGVYAQLAGVTIDDAPEPRTIAEIAAGEADGNRAAGIEAFRRLGEVAGDAIAQALALVDGLAVIGGGIAHAHRLFLPALVDAINRPYAKAGAAIPRRLIAQAFNLEAEEGRQGFTRDETCEIPVPGSAVQVVYDPVPRTGVGISRLGTSEAVGIGAYAFALRQLKPVKPFIILAVLCSLTGLRAQEFATPPDAVVVTADRTFTPAAESGVDVTSIDRAALDAAPAGRLDDILREQVPGFSLFRRSGSRVANPTTQGVSLRNVGPNGAGRTLVLLDGIPQNDPFGGWVYWSRLPPSAIERVEVLQGGGAGLFGNSALGGTIQLYSRQLAGDALTLDAQGGSRNTYETSVAGQRTVDSGALVLSARADRFSTDGYPTIRADQRGPVDLAADSEATLFETGVRWNVNASNSLTLKADAFREDRVNGTALTSNSTDAADFSASFDGELPESRIAYQLAAYGQLREYASTFSAVNAARTVETPSLDQYSVPAQAAGGSATVSLPLGATQRVLLGADERWVDGETDEKFRYLGGEFTRRREAGGRQLFTGLFAEDAWRPLPGSTLTASGRLDCYDNDQGSRRETDLATGAATLNERFAAHDGWSPNGRLGGEQQLWNAATHLRGSLYTGFRVPTLNELYRPFRVGNDITEANAALKNERLYGADLGLDTTVASTVQLSAGGYYNELHDPVANVTVASGGAVVAPFGFIPAGGVGRLRENLGRAQIYGGEAKAAWAPTSQWQVTLSYLYSHGIVASAPAQPALEGKRLAQAPEQQLVASVRWSPIARLQGLAEVRFVSDQFEDDLNTLRLDAYAMVDLSVTYTFLSAWEARAAVENLFNTEYETGKSADELVSIGAPRLITVGLRWSY